MPRGTERDRRDGEGHVAHRWRRRSRHAIEDESVLLSEGRVRRAEEVRGGERGME